MENSDKNKIKDIVVPESGYHEEDSKRNVSISRNVHFKAKKHALKNKLKLRQFVEEALLYYIDNFTEIQKKEENDKT